MDSKRHVLVIGGTGMLRSAVRSLTRRGLTVLSVARRPTRGAPEDPAPGAFVPITSEWSTPEALADDILAAMRHHGIPIPSVQGGIVWVHSLHRQAVLDQLERVLSPGATVLQLWGSATQDPRDVMAEGTRTERPWSMRHLLLGYRKERGVSRWLTGGEISGAALQAWDTDAPCTFAGQVDPWEHHP